MDDYRPLQAEPVPSPSPDVAVHQPPPDVRLPRARDLVLRSAAEVRRSEWRRRTDYAPSRDENAEAPALVGLLAALRAGVSVYVCGRRQECVPIWRVLPEVKALIREADPEVAHLATLAPLVDQVVRWTIEAYYDLPAGHRLAAVDRKAS